MSNPPIKDSKSQEAAIDQKSGRVTKVTDEKDKLLLLAKAGVSMPSSLARPAAYLKQIRTKLYYQTSSTGSAGAGLAFVVPLQPDAASEFTSYANLYDEIRCVGGKLHFVVESAGTAAQQGAFGGVCYDPTDNNTAALTGAERVMEFSTHKLVYLQLSNNTGGRGSNPTSVNAGGFWTLQAEVPTGTAQTKAALGIFGRQWYDTQASTSVVCGWFKMFVPAVTSNTWAFRVIVEMDVDFRSRR